MLFQIISFLSVTAVLENKAEKQKDQLLWITVIVDKYDHSLNKNMAVAIKIKICDIL